MIDRIKAIFILILKISR